MWNGPAGKGFFEQCHPAETVVVTIPAFQRGQKTAGLDEVRDAGGLIKPARYKRIAGKASPASGCRPTASSLF